MVYFTLNLDTEEVIQLIKQVDTKVFCLWQGEKGKSLFGVVKDSSFEFFIAACSLFTVRHMRYLTFEQISQRLRNNEPLVICGNRALMKY